MSLSRLPDLGAKSITSPQLALCPRAHTRSGLAIGVAASVGKGCLRSRNPKSEEASEGNRGAQPH